MFTRPEEPGEDDLRRSLSQGWHIAAERLEYLAAGFGSHHWTAETAAGDRWFVTVDLAPDGVFTQLHAALATARRLADDGMRGLVAPRPSAGGVLWTGSGRHVGYAVSVFPFVEGATLDDVPEPDRVAVLDLLADLHARTSSVLGVAHRDTLGIVGRPALLDRMRRLSVPWETGPYGERARRLLLPRVDAVHASLTRYDALVDAVDRTGWVITHGEPHDGNLLRTADGLALVDWDTARIAPAARDLRHVDEGEHAAAYTERTGRVVPADDLELYRLRWDLTEVAEYIAEFAHPHDGTDDAEIAFDGLAEALEGIARSA
jgi:hypothetical protein